MDRELRHALGKVINVAEWVGCEDLHHPKKHYHTANQVCPVKKELQQCVDMLREYMKKTAPEEGE